MGAGVTPDEKLDIAERLLRMQSMLRDVVDACNAHAEICKTLGEPGLAFASFMVGESISAFSKAVVRYSKTALDE